MIPIAELEKVLQGCISRTLKRVGRKEFIDLYIYLDMANGDIEQLEAELEAAKEADICCQLIEKHWALVPGGTSRPHDTRYCLVGKSATLDDMLMEIPNLSDRKTWIATAQKLADLGCEDVATTLAALKEV